MGKRYLPLDDPLYDYVLRHGVRESPEQAALREATRSVPHAGMQIAPEQGALMAMLVRLMGARRAIEIGVFTGYSSLSVAQALPDDGYLLACDIDATQPLALARPAWERAGVAHKVDLRIGPALATLDAELAAGAAGTYDFAFVDADKRGYDAYVERCLRLLRPGGLLVIDNTLWGGAVARADDASADTAALRALNAKLHADARVDVVILPFSDGVTLARKR